jgi:hypothetical protein
MGAAVVRLLAPAGGLATAALARALSLSRSFEVV